MKRMIMMTMMMMIVDVVCFYFIVVPLCFHLGWDLLVVVETPHQYCHTWFLAHYYAWIFDTHEIRQLIRTVAVSLNKYLIKHHREVQHNYSHVWCPCQQQHDAIAHAPRPDCNATLTCASAGSTYDCSNLQTQLLPCTLPAYITILCVLTSHHITSHDITWPHITSHHIT